MAFQVPAKSHFRLLSDSIALQSDGNGRKSARLALSRPANQFALATWALRV